MQAKYPLENLWPYSMSTEGDWEEDANLTACFQVGDFEPKLNSFVVMRLPKLSSSSVAKRYINIPRKYKNSLRLLNAKISYLQQCARLLSVSPLKSTSKEGRKNLRLARDSV